MSNMNMNIKIKLKDSETQYIFYWIDPEKLNNYTLPTFTKKIVKYLEKINEKNSNNRSWNFWFIYCKFISKKSRIIKLQSMKKIPQLI